MSKHYSDSIKEECITKRLAGRTVKSINEEYGLGVGTLQNWMKQYFENNSNTAEKSQIQSHAQLLRENEELKKELDFLKKAASYFASQQKK